MRRLIEFIFTAALSVASLTPQTAAAQSKDAGAMIAFPPAGF